MSPLFLKLRETLALTHAQSCLIQFPQMTQIQMLMSIFFFFYYHQEGNIMMNQLTSAFHFYVVSLS